MPFSVADNVDHPLSLYAASKKSNELMAHTYSELYDLPTTGLRFFTVYGPWGRPDYGNHKRDFTYIDDIVSGVIKVIDNPARKNENWNGKNPDPSSSRAPWKVYNIGNSSPVELNEFINAIETSLGKKAIKKLLPLQPGDVPDTFADVQALEKDFGYRPKTSVLEGIDKFVSWYKEYFRL